MEIRLLSGKEVLDAAILIKDVMEASTEPVYTKEAAQSCMDFFLENSSRFTCFGAFKEELIGLLAFEEENFHMSMFFVHPTYQRQGVGTLLMEAFTGTARAAGIARITVHAAAETIPVYEAMGFVKNGVMLKEEGIAVQPMEYLLGTEFLGKQVTVTVDQPYGSFHSTYADLEMPCNYGYVEELLVKQGVFQNAYVYGPEEPAEEVKGTVIGIVYHRDDSESRWIVSTTESFEKADVINVIGSLEEQYETRIIWVSDLS